MGGGGVPTGIASLPLLSPLKTEIMHVHNARFRGLSVPGGVRVAVLRHQGCVL